ncbi:MAG: hypothetical protein HQ508_00390 [Candidatus Marinimicrobia bacterium]|nr:hypothetical protein [Candidatus Neomarinimicrobiota bacterium]
MKQLNSPACAARFTPKFRVSLIAERSIISLESMHRWGGNLSPDKWPGKRVKLSPVINSRLDDCNQSVSVASGTLQKKI